ncbi:hypothetical protein [Hymenobacter sp.]|uniref:hypothetical protein n=1 Tax=Hymenobacter sp. TaxID=1898978 RepID=UPI00286A62A7|nr:hypothetical protein [Hymenobacter sp.]
MSATSPFSAFFRPVLLGTAVLLLGLAAGCSYSNGGPADLVVPCDATPQAVTYAGVISPIFDTHCRECHATNKASALGGGIVFNDYNDIAQFPSSTLLASIKHLPTGDPMPKGRAKIPECDILRIEAWMNAGKLNN